MRLAYFVPLFLALVPLGIQAKEKPAVRSDVAEIKGVVFRKVVEQHCQKTLCLLAVNGKALEPPHLAELAKLGQVAAPSEGDLELDESGMSGAARTRGAQIIDLLKVIVERNTAVVQVHIYSSIVDTTLCRYRLRRVQSGWLVDESVECTA
jgi:hypothetical protein